MHAITLDSKYGVPTVAIHTNAFEKAVQSVTRMHGMPEARYTFVPQPVMGKTAEQLRAYVEGKSPISGRPVSEEHKLDLAGIEVGFCCPNCKGKVAKAEKDEEKDED